MTTYVESGCLPGTADDGFGGAYFCVVPSHRVSCVRIGIELCQLLRIFLLTFFHRI